MKILATFISEWDEGVVETPVILNTIDCELKLEPFEPSDEGEDFEHLNSESVDVSMPDGTTFSLQVEDGELIPDQYLSLMDAIAKSSDNPISICEVTTYSSVGSSSKSTIIGTDGCISAFAAPGASIDGIQELDHIDASGVVVEFPNEGVLLIQQ
jgi:hypothetical protein